MSSTSSVRVLLVYVWLIYFMICPAVPVNAICTEGSLRMFVNAGSGGKFLQVCHIQDWRYICNWPFDHTVDKEVVLQQLGCKKGVTSSKWVLSNGYAHKLADYPCFGVEKMLMDCPRYLQLLPQSNCNSKVAVKCSGGTTRQCLNGELTKSETNVLYLCVSGQWNKLCSNLWGNLQAAVACQQLSQETLTPYDGHADFFENYIQCTGQEKKINECRFTLVGQDDCTKTPVNLICKKVEAPENIVLTSTSSNSVEANWTQPSSDSVWQYYTNHTITCTSTHGVYTATQHVNVSAAVNESMHTIITGLMANTSYNCCVSVYSELGRSEDVCGSVITDKYTELMQIISTIVPSCSVASDSGTFQAGFSTQISKPTSDSVMTKPTSVMTDAQCEANSSPLPWVAGIIIGAVLSAVICILLTVIVAVYLWRKKAQSQYKMSDSSTERRVSMSQTNQCYSSVQEPQPYEEYQPNRQDHQPAAADGVYSYADHTVNTNVYDSVPQSNENSADCYGNSKEDTTMPTVDNIALYSLCEQENGAYSQLNRK